MGLEILPCHDMKKSNIFYPFAQHRGHGASRSCRGIQGSVLVNGQEELCKPFYLIIIAHDQLLLIEKQ